MWYGIAALRPFEQYALFGVLFIAVLGLLYAWFLRRQVLHEDAGTPEMQKVWGAIREGANAYLKPEKTIKNHIAADRVADGLFVPVRIHCARIGRFYGTLCRVIPRKSKTDCRFRPRGRLHFGGGVFPAGGPVWYAYCRGR